MLVGIVAAVLAAVSWSLSFIVPFEIGRYSLYDFALVEFVISGALSAGLLCRDRNIVRTLELNDWLAAFSLGVIGYACYFVAVMGAAVYAGPVIAPAFFGLVPVVLAVSGNLRERTVKWKSLVMPMTLALSGLLLVNGSGFAQAGGMRARSLWLGIPLAILGIVLWTIFGMLNQSALAKRPNMKARVWTALMMVAAGAAMLLFLPLELAAGVLEFPRLGWHWSTSGPLLVWGVGLAVFANIGGAMAWTFASQRLPVALCAQMITMEPTSATVLGLIVHHRWPTAAEALGMFALLTGVVMAISIFSRSSVVAVAGAVA